jgi:integrase
MPLSDEAQEFKDLLLAHSKPKARSDFKTDFNKAEGSFHSRLMLYGNALLKGSSVRSFDMYLNKIKLVYRRNYPFNTRKAYNPKVKMMITTSAGNNADKLKSAKDFYLNTEEEFKKNKKSADKKVQLRNQEQLVVTLPEVAALMAKLKARQNLAAKIASVILATGSRLIEIISGDVAKFKKVRVRGCIQQTGTAKNKTDKIRKITKPVYGMTVAEVLQLISEIREETADPNVSNRELTNTYNARVNAIIAQTTKGFNWDNRIKSSHNLRALHVNTSYKLFAPKNESLISYLGRILGHDVAESLSNCATSYSWIKVRKGNKQHAAQSNDDNLRNEPGLTKEEKTTRLKKLIAKGKSYRDLNNYGYSNYLISKVKHEQS